MKAFVWRHNKTYHSHSMINEPCVHNGFYVDAVIVVVADNLEQALEKLAEREDGWRVDDLRELEPKIYELDEAKVIFTDLRGSIDHL